MTTVVSIGKGDGDAIALGEGATVGPGSGITLGAAVTLWYLLTPRG
jgi:hypothetical protein